MSDKLNERRNFIKRAGIVASVLAGFVVATAATTESKDRGAGSNVGNGVVVGTSTKRDTL
ncbi:MAG: formate dehydrogenase [Aliarcobacter sp.]